MQTLISIKKYYNLNEHSIDKYYDYKIDLDIIIEHDLKKYNLTPIVNLVDSEGFGYYIITKSGVEEIINEYYSRIKQNYLDLFNKAKEDKIEDIKGYIYRKFAEINYPETFYNLTDNNIVTNSWFLEYSIFNIIKFYKSFDSDNNILIFQIN